MCGVVSGVDVDFFDILVFNVWIEIIFGFFMGGDIFDEKIFIDGCIVFLYVFGDGRNKGVFLGQNWDWQLEQFFNFFVCYIVQFDSEVFDIVMIIEGGIIGKIGFNLRGVGVCLNVI